MKKDDTSKVEKNRGEFKKGREKTGGRTKGTPNKKTQDLQCLIEVKYPDFDPILRLIEIAEDEETPLEIRVQCYKEVSKYVHAQRKAVEMTADVDMPIISIKGL